MAALTDRQLTEALEKAKADLRALSGKLEAARQSELKAGQENNTLRSTVATLETKLEEASSELGTLRSENTELESQLRTATTQNDEHLQIALEAQQLNHDTEVYVLRQEVKELQVRLHLFREASKSLLKPSAPATPTGA